MICSAFIIDLFKRNGGIKVPVGTMQSEVPYVTINLIIAIISVSGFIRALIKSSMLPLQPVLGTLGILFHMHNMKWFFSTPEKFF